MKKRLTVSLLLILTAFIFLSAPQKAFALPGFSSLFMTDASGSTTPKSTFAPGETPYLYMNLEIPTGATASTFSFWHSPDGSVYNSGIFLGTETERWVTLPGWSSLQQTGDWVIYANYLDNFGNNASASTHLTVTPEPTTMSLLLISGLPVILKRKWKKRT